jgi:hypothetical protein
MLLEELKIKDCLNYPRWCNSYFIEAIENEIHSSCSNISSLAENISKSTMTQQQGLKKTEDQEILFNKK